MQRSPIRRLHANGHVTLCLHTAYCWAHTEACDNGHAHIHCGHGARRVCADSRLTSAFSDGVCHLTAGIIPAQANGTLNWAAEQAEALILEVLRLDPQNPLALHLHIHLVEATGALRCGRIQEPSGKASRPCTQHLSKSAVIS